MAAYGVATEIARVLGQTTHASLLEQTQAEEKQTDEKLADVAREINSQANEEGSEKQTDSSAAGRKTPSRAA